MMFRSSTGAEEDTAGTAMCRVGPVPKEQPMRPPSAPAGGPAASVVHAGAVPTQRPHAAASRPGVLMRGPVSVDAGAARVSRGGSQQDARAALASGSSGGAAVDGRGLRRSLKGLELHGEAVCAGEAWQAGTQLRQSWPSGGGSRGAAALVREGVASLARAAQGVMQNRFGVCVAPSDAETAAQQEEQSACAELAEGNPLRIVQLCAEAGAGRGVGCGARPAEGATAPEDGGGAAAWGHGRELGLSAESVLRSRGPLDSSEMARPSAAEPWQRPEAAAHSIAVHVDGAAVTRGDRGVRPSPRSPVRPDGGIVSACLAAAGRWCMYVLTCV